MFIVPPVTRSVGMYYRSLADQSASAPSAPAMAVDTSAEDMYRIPADVLAQILAAEHSGISPINMVRLLPDPVAWSRDLTDCQGPDKPDLVSPSVFTITGFAVQSGLCDTPDTAQENAEAAKMFQDNVYNLELTIWTHIRDTIYGLPHLPDPEACVRQLGPTNLTPWWTSTAQCDYDPWLFTRLECKPAVVPPELLPNGDIGFQLLQVWFADTVTSVARVANARTNLWRWQTERRYVAVFTDPQHTTP